MLDDLDDSTKARNQPLSTHRSPKRCHSPVNTSWSASIKRKRLAPMLVCGADAYHDVGVRKILTTYRQTGHCCPDPSCISRMVSISRIGTGNRLPSAISLTFISGGTYNPLPAGCNVLIQRKKWLILPILTNRAELEWSTSVPRSRLNGWLWLKPESFCFLKPSKRFNEERLPRGMSWPSLRLLV